MGHIVLYDRLLCEVVLVKDPIVDFAIKTLDFLRIKMRLKENGCITT